MKKRSPVVAAILSFIIPFYTLYWFYVTSKDMKGRGAKVPSLALLFGPYLGLIILLFLQLLTVGASGSGKRALNIIGLMLGMVCVLGLIIGIIIYFLRFSGAAEQVTNKKVSKFLAFILLFLIAPVGVFVIQEGLNSSVDTTPSTPTLMPQSPISPTFPDTPLPPATPPPTNGGFPS